MQHKLQDVCKVVLRQGTRYSTVCVCRHEGGGVCDHEGIDGWAAMSQKRIKALCSVAEILFTGNVCTDTGRGMTDLFFPRLDLTG